MNTNKTKFDTSALRDRILSQYDSIDQFAKVVGMTARTLNSRLDNHSYFYHHEIVSIRDALNLNTDEVTRLFFMPDDVNRDFADMVMQLNDKQRDLLIQILELLIGRPDREEYVLNYTGRMKDLPAALAQI